MTSRHREHGCGDHSQGRVLHVPSGDHRDGDYRSTAGDDPDSSVVPDQVGGVMNVMTL